MPASRRGCLFAATKAMPFDRYRTYRHIGPKPLAVWRQVRGRGAPARPSPERPRPTDFRRARLSRSEAGHNDVAMRREHDSQGRAGPQVIPEVGKTSASRTKVRLVMFLRPAETVLWTGVPGASLSLRGSPGPPSSGRRTSGGVEAGREYASRGVVKAPTPGINIYRGAGCGYRSTNREDPKVTNTANNRNKPRMAPLAPLGLGATLAFAVPASAESGQVEAKAQAAR